MLSGLVILGIRSEALAKQDGWTGNINVFFGAKTLDQEDWAPVDEHTEVGIDADFRPNSWPVNIAVDYLFSESDSELLFDPFLGVTEFKAETSELNIGIRKIWDRLPYARPFLGGGLSFIRGEFKGIPISGNTISDSDTGIGVWLGGGFYWTLTDHFNLGLELTFSTAEINLFGVDADAGGGHFGFLAGYHW
jgi:hypothetical protein